MSIGYGFAAILHINEIVSVVLVTRSIAWHGFTASLPCRGACIVSSIFPVKDIGWMLLASTVGGCVPVPVALRSDPEKKSFVSNMIQMKKQKKFLPNKG